ncbi:hypothetical protein DM02DRAFT_729558 [Periconia macrospinosa]|uniref:Rhodopsin domain-containing protein n=1 Tax=Periconia macrospinosa TaxID=97972 RepID=A0A2V1DL78_9PLEO|nr:hypothetical protein DM02DRAFT_729558 [Periconia macrospinosa]
MVDPITSPNSPTGEVTLAIDWLLLAISAAMILARLYLRLRINRQKIFPSDVLICLAWCAATTTVSLDIVLFRMNALRKNVDPFLHGYHRDKKSVQRALMIIPEFLKTSRRLLYSTIVYCVCAYTTSMLLNFFLCFPIQRNWEIGPTVCIFQPGTVFKTAWALNLFGDLIIFLLPFTFLHILNIRGGVRVGVYCTFGLAIVNIAFCLTRFLSIRLAPRNGRGTISITIIKIWSHLDMTMGVIVANLPSLAPYLRMMRTRPSEPAPRPSNNEPTRKNTLHKYQCGTLGDDSGISTLRSYERVNDKGKKTLKVELEDVGIISANGGVSLKSEETWKDIEMLDVGGVASLK